MYSFFKLFLCFPLVLTISLAKGWVLMTILSYDESRDVARNFLEGGLKSSKMSTTMVD